MNPCESGPGIHCDPNAHCLLIPEISDFKCECKPGYNGTGRVCTGKSETHYQIYKYTRMYKFINQTINDVHKDN